MQRGELYRVRDPAGDPKKFRSFLIVSRQTFVDSSYSTVAAIPVYTVANGAATEVGVGTEVGLTHHSVLRCDEVTSVQKRQLTNYVGRLPEDRMREVNRAMALALDISRSDLAGN